MKGRAALLASLLFVAGLAAAGVAARAALGDATDEIGRARPLPLVGAFVLLVAGRGALALYAWATIARVLARVPARAAAFAWLRSLPGKYIPGGIWQPVSALGSLQRAGARTGDAASVLVMDAAASIVSGLAVGVIALPALAATTEGTAVWLLLALPAFALLHPRVFALVFRTLRRVRGSGVETVAPPGALVARAVALHAAGWVLAGLSLAMVLAALGVPARAGVAIPAAALSWAAGLLFVIAPAGLGVREVVLLAVLAPVAPEDAALAAAVLSRVMFVAMDLAGTVLSMFVRPRGADAG